MPPLPPLQAHPDEVRGWFAGEVTDEELTRDLDILRADHNWRVDDEAGRHVRILSLVYAPGAARVTVVLWRDGAVWRPRLIP